MFRGISPLSLDSKGRLSIPARFRDRLSESGSEQVVVTIDRDGCLLLYPLPVWEQVEARLVQLSSTNRAARSLKRLLMGHAEELQPDASGRLLIPAPLREFAKLEKHVVLVGQGNKFELWDEQTWYRLREQWLAEDGGEAGTLPDDLESLSF